MAKPMSSLLSKRRGSDTTWHGAAFVVEALLLLLFLAFALAVFMQLFSAAHARGIEERALTQAVTLAANDAEEFAALPQAGSRTTAFDSDGHSLGDAAEGEYLVTREVTPERAEGGTLYRAVIEVTCEGEEIYRLESARYVSMGAAGTALGTDGQGEAKAPDAGRDEAAEGGEAA